MISVIVPVSVKDFKDGMLWKCQRFIDRAKYVCPEEVETIAVINEPSVGRVESKNYGAEQARGETLVFLDCDCIIGSMFLNEVSRKASNPYFIGGGVKFVKASRLSLGILLGGLLLAPYLLFRQITVGAFWIRRKDFIEMGGFRQKKYDDLDFAVRLQKLAKRTNRKFESLKESFLIWSTRKFDEWGDFHWMRSRGYRVKQQGET